MGYSNHEDGFSIQQYMLLVGGFWPRHNRTTFYKIQGILCILAPAFLATSLFLAVFYVEEFTELIESWTMFVSIANCVIKFCIFYYKNPTLLKILKSLQSIHFHYYDEDLDGYIQKAIRKARIMVKIFVTSAICTIISLVSTPIVSRKPRTLPLNFPIHLAGYSLPPYLSVFAFQMFSLSVCAWVSVGIDQVATCFMILSSAYFKILNKTIIRITKEYADRAVNYNANFKSDYYGTLDEEINKKLSLCVEHHLAVIRIAELTDSIFTYIFLVQFLASAVGICLAGFTLMIVPLGSSAFIVAVSLPITLVIQISFMCTFGNEVTVQSSRVIDACYMTEWVACGSSVRKTLFIIMERSKRPLILTAGKFIDLSLLSLVGVLKSAVSYGAVLRQLMNKD